MVQNFHQNLLKYTKECKKHQIEEFQYAIFPLEILGLKIALRVLNGYDVALGSHESGSERYEAYDECFLVITLLVFFD